jgi:hypothetical protein
MIINHHSLWDKRAVHCTCGPALRARAGRALRLPPAWIVCAVVGAVPFILLWVSTSFPLQDLI